jgi:kinesin family protein 11
MIIFFQAAQALESRINKMRETYTSGVGILKELENTLRLKASSDMEQIQNSVSSQALAVEKVIELLKNISFVSV